MTHCAVKRGLKGLTLLELMIVIVILALITATVTVRLGGRLPAAALHAATSQWESADQQMRMRARHVRQPMAIHFDIGGNRIQCALDAEHDEMRSPRTFPRGVRITKFVVFEQTYTNGPVSVMFRDSGASETYAVEFASGRDLRRWIFVVGLTGQVTEVENEKQVQELFQELGSPGVHAG